MNIPLSGSSCPLFPIELKFGLLVFVEGGNSEKNPESKDEN